MSHRHKGLLYALLTGGAKLEEIRRWKIGEIVGKVGKNPRNRIIRKLKNMSHKP